MKRALLGDAAQHEILGTVPGKIEISGFVEKDVEKPLSRCVGHVQAL
jgi:hypothetical protein